MFDESRNAPVPDGFDAAAAAKSLIGGLEVESRLWSGGEWRDAAGGKQFAVSDPATAETVTEIADAGPGDATAALDAASGAQAAWAKTPGRDRAEILRRLFDLVDAKRDELAQLISLESGKALPEARGEVAYGSEFIRWYAEEAAHIRGAYADSPAGGDRFVVERRPVGPCLHITPWNFPLAMVTRKIAPALAAGCTVVVKPPKETPLASLVMARLADEAGVPPGVLNVVTTSSSGPTVEALTSDARLRKLSFTGSTEVGRLLLRACSEHIIRTSMELGGNAPLIVFADADIELAVRETVIAKMRNAGESCIAANRIYVEDSVADEFTEAFVAAIAAMRVGHPLAGADVGPLINATEAERVEALVGEAVREGSELVVGGGAHGPGHFIEPAVLLDVPDGAAILDNEIFGPVAPVQRFTDEADVLARANATPFGLAAYLFTKDLDRAWRVSDGLDAGMIGVNKGVVSNVAAPFGGTKASGLGREGGPEGLDEYLEDRYVLFGNTLDR